MKTEDHTIQVNDKATISSSWLIPKAYQHALIIAHGAGQDMNSPFISALHEGIAARNILTVKFNFPYLEQGRKAPDRPPVLLATWQAVIDAVIERTGLATNHIFLSGKSMGGRYASLLAAEQTGFGGLILFGYPLHPAGKPEQLRYEHLSSIDNPTLFFQGSRDNLCKLDRLRPILARLTPQPDLHIIEGGDHSFKVLKSLNRSERSVWDEIIQISAEWICRNG